ncbi:MAG: hypothetical protein AAF651_13290, partial [Cyanobacteria bacterium P01_C01_bin.73]
QVDHHQVDHYKNHVAVQSCRQRRLNNVASVLLLIAPSIAEGLAPTQFDLQPGPNLSVDGCI